MKKNFKRKSRRPVLRLQDKKLKSAFIMLLKRKIKFYAIPVLFIFAVALFLFTGIIQMKRTHKVYSQVSDLENEFNKLEQDNKNLEAQIDNLTGPEVIDREARERLNLKKEGENVVVVISAERQAQFELQPQEKKNSFWEKVKSWFEF